MKIVVAATEVMFQLWWYWCVCAFIRGCHVCCCAPLFSLFCLKNDKFGLTRFFKVYLTNIKHHHRWHYFVSVFSSSSTSFFNDVMSVGVKMCAGILLNRQTGSKMKLFIVIFLAFIVVKFFAKFPKEEKLLNNKTKQGIDNNGQLLIYLKYFLFVLLESKHLKNANHFP